MEKYLRSFNLLTEQEIALALKAGKCHSLKKGEFLIKEGQVCKEVAFVHSGCLRSFHHNSEGAEITWCFSFPKHFVTAYSSFINQTKTLENIQALTDVELFCIPRADILRFEQTSINWIRLSRLFAEREFTKLEERVLLLLTEDAKMRYEKLADRHPEYLQNIPLNYLASYLGITQRHLSRIRRSVTI